MNDQLAQVLWVLFGFSALVAGLAPVLKRFRATRQIDIDPANEWQALQQQIADLEAELREERTRRRTAESKADEYEALELLYDESQTEFDTRLQTANTDAHDARVRLWLVMRHVPGATEYLAALDAEIAQAKAAKEGATAARHE